MKLSVAMATYNGARYIKTQLDSLAAQTRLPDELVITDDCSADDTEKIVLDYAATAPFPIRFERNETNLGYAQNFSRAMSLCSGDLIFLCDQDDQWLPEKLARHLALAGAFPNKACFLTDTYLADGELTPSGETKMQRMAEMGLPRDEFVMGCCASIRKDYLELILPVPETEASHDGWIVRFFRQLNLAEWAQEPLQLYRLHGANASDFFVNDPEQLTLKKRISTKLRRRIASLSDGSGMAMEYLFYHAFCQTMISRKADIIAVTSERQFRMAYDDAAKKERILGYRLRINNLGRFARLNFMITNRNSDLQKGLSLKSSLRDLLRRRSPNNPVMLDHHG